MTDARKPLDSALDLFVYVPVGLAVTAAEELPKLAAKGRSRVTTQLTMARVVGQFAFSRGRSLLEQRIENFASSPAASPGAPSGGGGPAAGVGGDGGRAEDRPVSYEQLTGSADTNRSVRAHLRPVPAGGDTGETEQRLAGSADATAEPAQPGVAPPEATSLAIPGYDSLSASQVVQRLAGLSKQELAEVGAYEEGHRGRRTILSRVSQLQDQ